MSRSLPTTQVEAGATGVVRGPLVVIRSAGVMAVRRSGKESLFSPWAATITPLPRAGLAVCESRLRIVQNSLLPRNERCAH